MTTLRPNLPLFARGPEGALRLLSFGLLLACGTDPDGPITGGGAVDGGSPPRTGTGLDGGSTAVPPGPTPSIPVTNDAGQSLCERRTVDAYGNAPEMLIVLDRSLSMTLYNRWQPSVQAVSGITRDFERLLAFGLTMFPGTAGVCGGGVVDVPCAALNAGNINGALQAAQTNGFTPTGPALQVAAQLFGDRNSALDAPRARPAYVLLVTDGEPSCQGIPGIEDTAQRMAAVSAVQQLKANNVPTYVFGYQIDQAFQPLMNQLAMEGGTEHYYAAESAADITDAFRMITKDVVRCDFELAEDADPTRVDVTIDGKSVTLDPADGWTINGRVVTLVGNSCNTIKDGTSHALNVEVACEALR